MSRFDRETRSIGTAAVAECADRSMGDPVMFAQNRVCTSPLWCSWTAPTPPPVWYTP
jgi:hypothetical protein